MLRLTLPSNWVTNASERKGMEGAHGATLANSAQGTDPSNKEIKKPITANKNDRHPLHPDISRLLRPHVGICMGVRKSLITPLPNMTNTIVGIIAIGLILYLLFTIIRPEKF
jgi:K+-transporting ATPase KdpF subunit